MNLATLQMFHQSAINYSMYSLSFLSQIRTEKQHRSKITNRLRVTPFVTSHVFLQRRIYLSDLVEPRLHAETAKPGSFHAACLLLQGIAPGHARSFLSCDLSLDSWESKSWITVSKIFLRTCMTTQFGVYHNVVIAIQSHSNHPVEWKPKHCIHSEIVSPKIVSFPKFRDTKIQCSMVTIIIVELFLFLWWECCFHCSDDRIIIPSSTKRHIPRINRRIIVWHVIVSLVSMFWNCMQFQNNWNNLVTSPKEFCWNLKKTRPLLRGEGWGEGKVSILQMISFSGIVGRSIPSWGTSSQITY